MFCFEVLSKALKVKSSGVKDMKTTVRYTALATFLAAILIVLLTIWSQDKEKPPARERSYIARSRSSLWSVEIPYLRNRSPLKHIEVSPDIFDTPIDASKQSYWQEFTSHRDSIQDKYALSTAMQTLHGFKGWAIDGCQAIESSSAGYHGTKVDSLPSTNLYIAIVMNRGAHFIVDQLAVVIQLRDLPWIQKVYVSIVEYGKNEDQGSFLLDLVEGCLVMADISYTVEQFRSDQSLLDTYYPQVEADLRNLAIQPLLKMWKQGNTFDRVLWLRGFICPDNLITMVETSYTHNASMVCGMDWRVQGAEGRLEFTDVWRTRDINGMAFRKVDSKVATEPETGPVRDEISADRFQKRLPFQVFCCEGGSHVVDPTNTYYRQLSYTVEDPDKEEDMNDSSACMDSAQMHFCRDIWLQRAKDGLETRVLEDYRERKSKLNISPASRKAGLRALAEDADILAANINPATILIHPACLTTYVDGSHAQLVTDFAAAIQNDDSTSDDAIPLRLAPHSYLCNEMRTRGGREASKTQRWLRFDLVGDLRKWANKL